MISICKVKYLKRNGNRRRIRQKYTDVSHFVCHVLAGHIVRQVLEEVMPEDAGYAAEQCGVDALALEDVVNVLSVAVELSGEPRHRALLPPQLSLNLAADMIHGGHIFIYKESRTAQALKVEQMSRQA